MSDHRQWGAGDVYCETFNASFEPHEGDKGKCPWCGEEVSL